MLVFLPIHVCCGFFLVEKKLFGMVVVWIFSSQGILGDDDGSGDGVIDVLGSVPWFLFFPRIMLGLDLFPVGCLSRLFCFLSDSYVGGGWGRVAVVVRVVHDDGVICRGIAPTMFSSALVFVSSVSFTAPSVPISLVAALAP
jgi:hypothetical protein